MGPSADPPGPLRGDRRADPANSGLPPVLLAGLAAVAIATFAGEAAAMSVAINAGIASSGTRAVLIQDLIPTQRTASTYVLGLALRTRHGYSVEVDWLRGLSSENYALSGAGGRQSESIVGAAIWLDASLTRDRAITPFAGVGGRYTECEVTLEIGTAGPQTLSIERGAFARIGMECRPHRWVGMRGWFSEGWIHGTGDNRSTGYTHQWSMLSPGAGIELRLFLFDGGAADLTP